VHTTGKPRAEFNVTLTGDRFPAIKFKEQFRLGTFVVGVAADDGDTIVQNRNNRFRLDDPLNKLTEAFPDSPRIKKFVECLIDSK